MNIIAFDIGDARIGVAYGQTQGAVACPIKVFPADQVINNSKPFRELIDEYLPDKLVFGLPKSLSGDNSKQTDHVKKIAKKIAANLNLPFDFEDERYSSSEAKKLLRDQGLSEKQMRGKIDSVAASLFLETYLKRLNN